MPATAQDIIAEVEGAVRGGLPARRAQILRQVTGLFVTNAARFDERQIGIFDEVMVRLLEQAETSTLVPLSTMLAAVTSPPKQAARHLADHEEAVVAAPMLRNSKSLSETDLIEIASRRGQLHLLAIANRASLGEVLTDALLMRGDTNVCRALASNAGARLSFRGYSTLAARAERDDDIADSLVLRPDIPATVLDELLAKVTRLARTRLLNLAPLQVRGAMLEAVQRIEAEASSKPRALIDYSEAKSIVLALNKDGKLSDSAVNRFAVRQEHRNLVAALALLATVEIEAVEPLLDQSDGCGLMIACRASRLNWHTTLAAVTHRKNARKFSPLEAERCREAFEALPLSVAQWTIRFGSVQDFADKFSSSENASIGVGSRT